MIELADECLVATETRDSSAALVWGPKIGYIFRTPVEEGTEVDMELVALAACFVRLSNDPDFRDEMVQWYVKNQN